MFSYELSKGTKGEAESIETSAKEDLLAKPSTDKTDVYNKYLFKEYIIMNLQIVAVLFLKRLLNFKTFVSQLKAGSCKTKVIPRHSLD